MSAWQPIETAPAKVFVLGYFGGDGAVADGGSRFTTCRRNFSIWYCDDGERLFSSPTHWMPLPEPPEQPK